VFPDGRFVPKWTRGIAIVLLVAGLANSVAPGSPLDLFNWSPVIAALFAAMIVLAQTYRYRFVSTVTERQQTKWVVFGLVFTSVAYVGYVNGFGTPLDVLPVEGSPAMAILELALTTSLALGLLALPATIGAAVLRYRLFDIDLFINRTIVYGSVTPVLLGAFVLVSTLMQRSLEALTGARSDALTLGVALVLALGFQPLRARVRAVVDLVLPSRAELALMFTDIVGSTDRLAALGDAAWRDVLDHYRATVRRELKRHGGSEMHIAGDSFFATFTDPWRAVRCTLALRPRLSALGVPSRFGLHWGACEMRGEEVSGLAVWTAARVMSTAAADEVVLSDTMRLALGSTDLALEDRGVQSLKGIPEQLRLHVISRR